MVNLGTPCDLGGNDLPPNTPPVNHDEPDGTGPSWHPFTAVCINNGTGASRLRQTNEISSDGT